MMFRPVDHGPVDDVPREPDSPFHAIVVAVENVIQDGIEREFRAVGNTRLTVELLSGAMRAGVERGSRDPAALTATVDAAQQTILASLRPGHGYGGSGPGRDQAVHRVPPGTPAAASDGSSSPSTRAALRPAT
jgi:hypothetical protein